MTNMEKLFEGGASAVARFALCDWPCSTCALMQICTDTMPNGNCLEGITAWLMSECEEDAQ